MSGPIVRRYGFPNFEKIFGERDLQHGVDESETPEKADEKPARPEASSPDEGTKPATPTTGDEK